MLNLIQHPHSKIRKKIPDQVRNDVEGIRHDVKREL